MLWHDKFFIENELNIRWCPYSSRDLSVYIKGIMIWRKIKLRERIQIPQSEYSVKLHCYSNYRYLGIKSSS